LFDEEQVNDELDEWIYFFKTGEVLDTFTADGLEEAKVKLDKMKLAPEERKAYEAYVERLRKIASRQITDIQDIKDAMEKKVSDIVLALHANGVAIPIIAASVKISEDEIRAIIEKGSAEEV